MVLKQDGSVWATGYNEYGQLGDKTTEANKLFARVISDGAKAVAAGGFHSMVIMQDNSIWATGLNKYGQFGDGTTISKKMFVWLRLYDHGAGHDAIICR